MGHADWECQPFRARRTDVQLHRGVTEGAPSEEAPRTTEKLPKGGHLRQRRPSRVHWRATPRHACYRSRRGLWRHPCDAKRRWETPCSRNAGNLDRTMAVSHRLLLDIEVCSSVYQFRALKI